MKYIFVLILFLVGCQGSPPLTEYSIARIALKAAQKTNAEQLAPGYWMKANQFYQRGQAYYKRKKYAQSVHFFKQAILHAEQAENIARVKKMKSGTPF